MNIVLRLFLSGVVASVMWLRGPSKLLKIKIGMSKDYDVLLCIQHSQNMLTCVVKQAYL